MDDLAKERTGILGPARQVVVAAGDDHAPIPSRPRPPGEADIEAAVAVGRNAGDALAEFDVWRQSKLGDVVPEVSEHAFVAWIFGVVLIEHGQVIKARRADAGDEV